MRHASGRPCRMGRSARILAPALHFVPVVAIALPLALALVLGAPLRAAAGGDRAGRFDYYVLSLSWSPTWCALTGDARHSPQCSARPGFGFTLHGLWPQNDRGYPSFCRTSQRDPTRAQTAAMADITGTPGLAWHEWKKHGRCTGLSAARYYEAARKAFDSIAIPQVFKKLHRDVKLPAAVVEQAFLEANKGLSADMVTVTCEAGRIDEVRICLTKSLRPRPCGADVVRDCAATGALMDGMP
ncbi:ribonuclease T2 [Acidimangrovimonas sediminis]|uniref:ribonuclease T2 n=1 Tax=Acidimangrovimonas sediminis TaxID=2056283 RepID=UPI001E2F75B3|nr:ribonuclease T2 [Acidimangrovimonas sediminis]